MEENENFRQYLLLKLKNQLKDQEEILKQFTEELLRRIDIQKILDELGQ